MTDCTSLSTCSSSFLLVATHPTNTGHLLSWGMPQDSGLQDTQPAVPIALS